MPLELVVRGVVVLPGTGLLADLVGVIGEVQERFAFLGKCGVGRQWLDGVELVLASALALVSLPDGGSDLLVVAFDLLERLIRNFAGNQRGCGAEQAVADPDAGIEETEWLAGSRASNHSDTLASSAASGLTSTP